MLETRNSVRVVKTIPATLPNPGDITHASGDVQGRQLVSPYTIRDLTLTAYTTLNSNNETNLFTAPSGFFADLIHVSCANGSTASVTVDIRCGTGGAVTRTISIPAGTQMSEDVLIPIPMPETGQAWTVKFNSTVMGADISGTNVFVDGSFIQNQ